ncbi:MAG: carotenoid oxygenase family protein [Burkholderiales bacterium]|nr:carotenoid oxygenase family protein [Burkholderiales bacterium]
MAHPDLLSRRRFLAAGAALASTPLWAAGTSSPAPGAWQPAAPFGDHPALAPLRGLQGQDLACDTLAVQGRWPAGLRGTLYRNGPGLMERAGQRYHHWFDGDGLVQAWRFDGEGGASHRARFVQTAKFRAEQAAGEFLVPAFGTAIAAKRPLRGPDDMNVANTSVLPLPGRLLALWEGGSAHALDPDTLATRGPVAWTPELTGMPFSAHPKVEPDGTVWNFGTAHDKLVLYQLDAAGALRRHAVTAMPPCAMVHDFVVTARFLVFLLAPLTLDMAAVRGGAAFTEAMRWQPVGGPQATRVLVVDKADFQRQRVLEIPACMVFHFANGWDDGNLITLDLVRAADYPRLDARLQDVARGEFRGSEPSRPALLQLDLRRGSHRWTLGEASVEFPVVDPRVVARRHRHTWCPAALSAGHERRFGFDSLLALDRERGTQQAFTFGPQAVVEEHVFVPRPGSTAEGDGWLLGTGYDITRRRSFASVFEARALSDGPVAVAWLPYALPYGFHGQFVAG